MRFLAIMAFDDFIMQPGTVYTPQSLNEILGRYDKLSVMLVSDSIGGTASASVSLEYSADQRNWLAKSVAGSFLIPLSGISAGTSSVLAGGDVSLVGNLAYVRMAINLSGAGSSAHMKLWVTSRDAVSYA